MMKKLIVLVMLLALGSALAQVKEYYITCNPDDFNKIYKDYNRDTYINISLKYLDKTWDNLSLRIRGDDTRMLPKKSLKIKFENEPFIDGKNTINFNAEYEDESYIAQFMASLTFHKAGYPCYVAEHARLYLNGKFLGLYLRVENIDDQFLKANSLDTKANLYKASEDDACLTIYDDVSGFWEKKTNENSSWDDLYSLIDSLFYVPDSQYYEFAKRTFDYDRMVDILAINMLIAHGSTYYHNYFMFHDINKSGKWIMLPWDMDKSFYKYGYLYPYHRSSSYNSHDNPFIERAIIDNKIFDDIKKRIDFFANDFFNNTFFDPVIDSLYNLIRTSVEEDKTDNITQTSKWEERAETNKKYIRERYNQLKLQFNSLPRSFRVEPTFGTKTLPFKFVWHPSKNPDGSNVKYKFFIGKEKNLEELSEYSASEITDTTYTLTTLADTGLYYWKVMAYNAVGSLDGYDYPNLITIKEPTVLPCEIKTNTTLTKDKSPYLVNCNVEVEPNVNLVIEKGVEVVFSGNYEIHVLGNFNSLGTKEEPVIFEPNKTGDSWNRLYFENSNVNIEYSTIKEGLIYSKNTIFKASNLNIECQLKDLSDIYAMLYCVGGTVEVNNSYFKNTGVGAGILIHFSVTKIDSSIFFNCPDAIEFLNVYQGYITNNKIYYSSDDGIDLDDGDNIEIIGNFIVGAFDKGISVGNEQFGSSDSVLIKNNTIVNCQTGISVKDSSDVIIDRNTLFNNEIGIECYEKWDNYGGGVAKILNTIISGSIIPIEIDELSSMEFRYSLCDSLNLKGFNNIKTNPLFFNEQNLDFRLQRNSPCIDAGDPDTELDPDGTRADIGAYYFNQQVPKIVINEINYNSSPDYDSDDWVELVNFDEFDVDISNWIFKDSDDSHAFVFPDNIILKQGSYIVLAADSIKFKSIFKNVDNLIGNMIFGLSGTGEKIRLFDNYNKLIDSVEYDDVEPWDIKADGRGYSLELIHPGLDNNIATNWRCSGGRGTPGRINDSFTDTNRDEVDKQLTILKAYPNPAKDYIILEVLSSISEPFDISLIDISGKIIKPEFEVLSVVDNKKNLKIALKGISFGFYQVVFSNKNDSVHIGFFKFK